jgi:c-di-GMP-binding flagellar brake protein YcgR
VSQDDVETKGSIYHSKHSAATAEHRRLYRHRIQWRIALVHKNGDKNDIYHGRTSDLSATGANILVDHNIFVMGEVVLLLAIPPLHAGLKETLLEIDSRMVYTVLTAEHSQFRIGLRFLHFKGEGKRILTETLSKRAIPKSDEY